MVARLRARHATNRSPDQGANVVDDFTRESSRSRSTRRSPVNRVARVLDVIAEDTRLPEDHRHGQRHGADESGDAASGLADRQSACTTSHLESRHRTPSSKASTASFATSASTSTCSHRSARLAERSRRWRRDYNSARPHRGLGQQTPEGFAQSLQNYPTLPQKWHNFWVPVT